MRCVCFGNNLTQVFGVGKPEDREYCCTPEATATSRYVSMATMGGTAPTYNSVVRVAGVLASYQPHDLQRLRIKGSAIRKETARPLGSEAFLW